MRKNREADESAIKSFMFGGQLKKYRDYFLSSGGEIKDYSAGTVIQRGGEISENCYYPSVTTSSAACDSTAIVVSEKIMRRLMKQRPDFVWDILSYYKNVLRLMCYYTEISSGTIVESRLASYILLYLEGEDSKNRYIPFTQDALAEITGSSRAQIARTCAAWKKEGIIDTQKGRLVVLDKKAIAEKI